MRIKANIQAPRRARLRAELFSFRLIRKNLTNKTIKHITVEFTYYNSVGDRVFSKKEKRTGLIAPGEIIEIEVEVSDHTPGYYGIFRDNDDFSKVELSKITIEYSDGTTEIGKYGLFGKEINDYRSYENT